jgi:hypothetical protein
MGGVGGVLTARSDNFERWVVVRWVIKHHSLAVEEVGVGDQKLLDGSPVLAAVFWGRGGGGAQLEEKAVEFWLGSARGRKTPRQKQALLPFTRV